MRTRVNDLVDLLLEAASTYSKTRCVICGAVDDLNTAHFVIPVSYIATCLVLNNLEARYKDLPLRFAFLCRAHDRYFDSLFADIGNVTLDVKRLERRAMVMQATRLGQLLVFGGPRALKMAEEFHASIAALKNASDSKKGG